LYHKGVYLRDKSYDNTEVDEDDAYRGPGWKHYNN
jgi:hypothetical protein